MSDDIVARLRGRDGSTSGLVSREEAADEIERLQTALMSAALLLCNPENISEDLDDLLMAFYRDTGKWPPGKSLSDAMYGSVEQADMKEFQDRRGKKTGEVKRNINALLKTSPKQQEADNG